jgi:membrane-bound serine protease (ClpP class)
VVLAFFFVLAIFLPSPWAAIAVACGIVGEIVEVVWGRRLAKKPARTGVDALVGQLGRVVDECRPTGSVRVGGELWEATCPAGAAAGASVVVVGGHDLTLDVEPAPASSQRGDAQAPAPGFS